MRCYNKLNKSIGDIKMDKNYYLGLDIGSDSVGWAVTDTDYNLLRLKGKTAWGARIFDSATDSKTRRGFRSNRRRSQRRKYRVGVLNDLFFKELEKVDDTFLLRLSESNLLLEDKENVKCKYPLFKERKLEKEFYKKYPTIYHLRSDQYHDKSDAFSDIRYLYLTLHHIIKYRGNFLRSGDINFKKFDTKIFDDINEKMNFVFLASLDEEGESESIVFLDKFNYENFLNCLLDKTIDKIEKKKRIGELIYPFKESKRMKQIADKLFKTLLVSGKADIKDLVDSEESVMLSLDETFEDTLSLYQTVLAELCDVLVDIKNIYDYVFIANLIGDNDILSDAYVSIFSEHENDLRLLKELIKKVDNQLGLNGKYRYYYKVFKEKPSSDKAEDQINNYQCFIKSVYSGSHASLDEFNVFLNKILTEEKFKTAAEMDSNYQYLLNKCDSKTLLARISDNSSSSIPHQLHLEELKRILKNANKHFPNFVNNELIDKLITLFKFRIPYFVGPLSKNESAFSNIVRNSQEHITPFNFAQTVNLEKTKERFINQRLNFCTYIYDEFVLPKNSILYMDFVNLNKLNTLTINNSQITQEVKLDLFNNLVKRHPKTTIKTIAKYLKDHYEVYAKDDVSIAGINDKDDFDSYARAKLYKIFKINPDTDELDLDLCEDIIKIMTIYKDSKDDGAQFVHKKYPFLSKDIIDKIAQLNFAGWGRLSKKTLNGIYCVDSNGEIGSETIIDVLYNTTLNFEQILHSHRYNFQMAIDSYNKSLVGENKSSKEIIKEKIENMPALMRRSVIQALGIINEIRYITKRDPVKITLEVTRNDGDKKETKSRKKELEEYLSSIIKDKKVDEYFKSKALNVQNELAEGIIKEEDLKGKHLYLYVKQLGIDLYSGQQMDIAGVLKGDYDLDHIIPKSLKPGDDSLDNLVLVSKTINEEDKGDFYPIVAKIRKKSEIVKCWKFLLSRKMISKEKYYRLTRDTELSEEELSGFISRQINAVNYSNVVLRDILMLLLPHTQIIFSKATYPAFLRNELELPKIRELNDTHHAVDAYLNIITGTMLMKHFGNIGLIKAKKDQEQRIKRGEVIEPNKIISFNMKEYLKKKIKKISNKIQTIALRHDMLLTFRYSYSDNAYYNQTIYKKGNGALLPIHTKNNSPFINTEKYGGYSDLKSEYMIIVYNTKEKRNEIVAVPHLFIDLYKDEQMLINKLKEYFKLKDHYIFDLDERVYNNTKIICGGCAYLVNTCNEKRIKLKLASSLFLKYDNLLKLKKLFSLEHRLDIDVKDKEEVTFFTDKNKTKSVTISKKDNLDIVKELIAISHQKRFDFYQVRVKMLRNYNLEEFMLYNLREQLKEIKKMLFVFNRSNGFLISKTQLFSKNVKIQYDSFTGLYSKVV